MPPVLRCEFTRIQAVTVPAHHSHLRVFCQPLLSAIAERVGSTSTTCLRSRSTRIVPKDWPFLQAQSSTPNTRVAGCGNAPAGTDATTCRSKVCRLTGMPSRLNNRWPGRPPNARPTRRWTSLKRLVDVHAATSFEQSVRQRSAANARQCGNASDSAGALELQTFLVAGGLEAFANNGYGGNVRSHYSWDKQHDWTLGLHNPISLCSTTLREPRSFKPKSTFAQDNFSAILKNYRKPLRLHQR